MAITQTEALERILQGAADRGDVGSILLVADEPVAYRIESGALERTEGAVLTADDIGVMAEAAVGAERLAALGEESSHVQTSCSLPGVLDGRMSISRSNGRCSIIVRVLPRQDMDLVRSVGLPETVIDAALEPWGLILVTGPADSGKTTSEYALLSAINDRKACHICTVEYIVGLNLQPNRSIVQQREVGIDVADCLGGIQASMAQDLDVLMVGEIRTVDDLEACIRIASLGHLVITQLHTPTAESAIARMNELVDDTTRGQLARCLRVVLAQHLLPRADGNGRVAAFGVLLPDEAMRDAIREGRPVLDRDAPVPAECRSVEDDVKRLLVEGEITAEAAEAFAAASR